MKFDSRKWGEKFKFIDGHVYSDFSYYSCRNMLWRIFCRTTHLYSLFVVLR
jgi:hypothetical protein